MGAFKTWETVETLRHSHDDQLRETIPAIAWDAVPPDAFNAILLFNLEAAWEEGHVILAIGPVGGPFETYSYYRHSTQLVAPGIMACLKTPMTFDEIIGASGWIVHGQPGNWWNEHVNAALALWCDRGAYEAIRKRAEARKANTGTYNLITYNCLTFVEECLAGGGIALEAANGRPLRTFIPKDAFRETENVCGAHKYNAWKYWFDVTDAPKNGLRSILDLPGEDRPLE